jgi:hypothetical protein
MRVPPFASRNRGEGHAPETERKDGTMKCGTQTALAVGAGYLLGRRRKFKLAVGLSVAAATGGFGGLTGQLLKRGGKLVGSSDALGKLSPGLGEVTDLIRGDLLEAGKTAMLTAARGQLDRVSDKLHDRADAIRQASERGGDGTGEARGGDEGEPEDFEEAEEPEEPEDLDEAEPAEAVDEEPEDEEPEEEPAPSRRRSSSTGGSRTRSTAGAPVRRTRR